MEIAWTLYLFPPSILAASEYCRDFVESAQNQWIKPCHYSDTNTLFDATHEILDGIGRKYRVNYNKVA